MRDVFLPAPLAEADLLAAVLGEGAPAVAPATLEGHVLRADPRGARVALTAAPGERAPGGVLRLGAEDAERLVYVLRGLAGGAERRAASPAGLAAEIYVGDGAGLAALRDPPDPEWLAHLAEAAGEVASHFGRRPVEEIPALLRGVSYRALARVRGACDAAPVRRRRGFDRGAVEPLGVARPYAKYFGMEEHRLRHRRFDGRMSDVVDRAVFVSGDAVTVLPFDPARREILLIEQFRIGPLARRDPRPWCLEVVAGRCDAGERAEDTARREAREEAGIALGRVERIAAYYTSPGVMAEHITAFVGEADLREAGGLHGLADEQEDIRVMVLPLAEAMDLADAGEINNAPLLVSLLWLGARADALARRWAASTG